MLINVWVKDKYNGIIHQVGTDKHDSITTMDGKIVYENLQNGDGSGSECPGYEVIEPPDIDGHIGVKAEGIEKGIDEGMKIDTSEPCHVKAADLESGKIYTYECYPCPNCGKWIHANKAHKFCSYCGIKLKWS